MTERKPFLDMPTPGWADNFQPGDLVYFGSDVREMREKYEARIAELEKRVAKVKNDCGRFIDEASRERNEALGRAEKAEARIRELTERRPIETAPFGEDVLVITKNGARLVLFRMSPDVPDAWSADWYAEELDSWLPLQEVSRG